MNRHTRDELLDYLAWAVLLGLLFFVLVWVSGCSTLKSAGSGAIGAGLGFLVPPFGPVIGAGIGAALGSMLAVNDALQHVVTHSYGPPPAPWFLRWQTWALVVAAAFVLRNREHLFAFLKTERGFKLRTLGGGFLHSFAGGKIGKARR